MKNNLLINEIFTSIQGEGFWAGKVCVFVRFAGCNLSCKWCDTKYASKVKMELEAVEVARKVMEFGLVHVVLTGGEPTIQNSVKMQLLLGLLQSRTTPRYVQLETNGTLLPDWVKYVDWRTVSPKRVLKPVHLRECNEIKVVYDDHSTDELSAFEEYAAREKNVHLFLQPKSNKGREIRKCIETIKRRKKWRLGLQLHKILNIR